LTMENQKVDFRLVEGRVYHQDMSMTIGTTTIRTRGWVGLDETINIIAEVPIRKEWAQSNPALANLRDQTLQVPITGTLRKWKIDDRVIQQLLGQFIQGTARGLLEGELNKQLDRLLPVPQQR
jgi:translocation and assembly module TamB